MELIEQIDYFAHRTCDERTGTCERRAEGQCSACQLNMLRFYIQKIDEGFEPDKAYNWAFENYSRAYKQVTYEYDAHERYYFNGEPYKTERTVV